MIIRKIIQENTRDFIKQRLFYFRSLQNDAHSSGLFFYAIL